MIFSTYQGHYNLSHDDAYAKIADKLNYKDAGELEEECKTNPELNNAVRAFCDAFAEIRSSLNFSDAHRYSKGSEAQIQNWGEARKLFDKLYPGGDLSDFDSKDFQDALFNQFFELDPNTGEYKPKEDSLFAIDGTSTMEPAENDALRDWLKNGGNGNYESPYKKLQDSFNEAENTRPIVIDPLLVDLDGDGIETTTVEYGAYFDHQTDGFAESSAWVGQDDGVLAFDKNANGTIDNGNEIFGDNYIKADGTKATSGFDALSDLDTNNDGVINSADANFNDLKVLKGDGNLLTLAEAGIESINLNSSDYRTKIISRNKTRSKFCYSI